MMSRIDIGLEATVRDEDYANPKKIQNEHERASVLVRQEVSLYRSAFPDVLLAIDDSLITRYENGDAAEAWVKFDFLGLRRQLGAVPAVAPARAC